MKFFLQCSAGIFMTAFSTLSYAAPSHGSLTSLSLECRQPFSPDIILSGSNNNPTARHQTNEYLSTALKDDSAVSTSEPFVVTLEQTSDDPYTIEVIYTSWLRYNDFSPEGQHILTSLVSMLPQAPDLSNEATLIRVNVPTDPNDTYVIVDVFADGEFIKGGALGIMPVLCN